MQFMTWMLTAAITLGVLTTAPVAANDALPAVTAYGLTTDQRLVRFNTRFPRATLNIGNISGLQAPDTALVGIDFRVQDRRLYGLGDGGGIYTLNLSNAAATLVTQLTVPLNGTAFGVDFNPAANALRIISNTGQNLRHPFAGTLQFITQNDGALNYTAGTPALGLTGAAYTNNDLDPTTGTTLFDIDSALNQVVIQSPPNAGSLVATGQLGVDPDTQVGFDIYTSLSAPNGPTEANVGFASLLVNGVRGLYLLNPLIGRATLIDNFRTRDDVIDIAIRLSAQLP